MSKYLSKQGKWLINVFLKVHKVIYSLDKHEDMNLDIQHKHTSTDMVVHACDHINSSQRQVDVRGLCNANLGNNLEML